MHKLTGHLIVTWLALGACAGGDGASDASAANGPPEDATADTATQSRDTTPGSTWIERLERSDRTAGLRIDDVIEALNLQAGDVVADIGAGAGAFTLPFAEAVAPTGRVLAVEIWPELLNYIATKAETAGIDNIEAILCTPDDPNLPPGEVDLAYFHDVFHNVPDRQAYLKRLASHLKEDGRIAIIEQEYDDPIAQMWDVPENRITPQQLEVWMMNAGFELVAKFDMFHGDENPENTGMPERWFVVYARTTQ